MRVLTVRQPWATLIAHGVKTIENRSRATKHRGPLAIHAGHAVDCDRELYDGIRDDCLSEGVRIPSWDDMTAACGHIVCTVDVSDCQHFDELDDDEADRWDAEGPYCWLLDDPVLLAEPIRAKGALGLWQHDLT